jgi:outer membrane protein TolC
MRIPAMALLLLLATTQAFALTLDEAIEAALHNHQRIEQFRANADQSKATVGTARAAFLPRVDLDYSYLKRDDDYSDFGIYNSTLSLGASLNLFNGLSDYHNYRAAQQRSRGANHQLQGSRADIVLETRQAYIEVLRAERSVETAKEGVELLERQKRDANLQFDYGLIARNDLLRVEVELSSARQDLLQTEGQQQIARRQLERTIGVRLPEEETLTDLTAAALQSFDPVQAESYRQELLENRSELHFLRSELQAAKRERRANKGDYLPRVDLAVAHEQYGDDLSPTGSDENDNLLTLNASWNLFDGFAREKSIAAADARVRAVAAELRDTEAALVLQLETALQNARIAGGRQQEARTGVTSAEENYRVTENRFRQQQATTVDLLDAQFLLTRSRNLEIDARYDLLLSSAQLERILERERR